MHKEKSFFESENTDVEDGTGDEGETKYRRKTEEIQETKIEEKEEDETKSQDGHTDKAPEHGLSVDAAFQELIIKEQSASTDEDSQSSDAEE